MELTITELTNMGIDEEIAKTKLEEYGELVEQCEVETYDIQDPDDMDNLSEDLNICEYSICDVTRYGKTKRMVMMYNLLSNEWEHFQSYHANIIDIGESTYSDRESAENALETMNTNQEDHLSQLEDSATDDDRAEYEEEKSRFESNRDSFYGYAKNNNDMKSFNSMYGNGSFPTFGEWLHDRVLS